MTITKQSDRSFQVQLRNRTEDFTLLGKKLISVNAQPTICGAIILTPTICNLLHGMRPGENVSL